MGSGEVIRDKNRKLENSAFIKNKVLVIIVKMFNFIKNLVGPLK